VSRPPGPYVPPVIRQDEEGRFKEFTGKFCPAPGCTRSRRQLGTIRPSGYLFGSIAEWQGPQSAWVEGAISGLPPSGKCQAESGCVAGMKPTSRQSPKTLHKDLQGGLPHTHPVPKKKGDPWAALPMPT
jgi:hypothetical protein